MKDERLNRLAGMIVNYSTEVKPKEKVLLRGSAIAQPFLLALYQEVLKAGGYPLLMPSVPGAAELFYKLGNDDQLSYLPEPVSYTHLTLPTIYSV